MIHARKQNYKPLLRIRNFFTHTGVHYGCKLVKHSANLGQTSSFFHQDIKRLAVVKRQESSWIASFSLSMTMEKHRSFAFMMPLFFGCSSEYMILHGDQTRWEKYAAPLVMLTSIIPALNLPSYTQLDRSCHF